MTSLKVTTMVPRHDRIETLGYFLEVIHQGKPGEKMQVPRRLDRKG